MKIIRNKLIPIGYAKCFNLFGVLFVKEKAKISNIDINHESIHTQQIKELLYLGFYLLYGIEFLYKLIKIRQAHAAYKNISFEVEAYKHEDDMNYLKTRKPYAMWHK